jgi:hypothetical protein
MRFCLIGILALLLNSCAQSGVELTRYHEDGRKKPAVLITQLIDTSSFEAPWSLSEELTDLVSREVGRNRALYITTQPDFFFSESPFSNDLSTIAADCSPHEFGVFLELVEHSYTPANSDRHAIPLETALNLNMAVRIRVIDFRQGAPKVILQELVRDTYYIPRTLLPTDYTVEGWGTSDFRKTPMGIAHAQLAQTLATRLSDYILLAKSQ